MRRTLSDMVSFEAWELEAVRMEEYSTQQNQIMRDAIDSPSKAGSCFCNKINNKNFIIALCIALWENILRGKNEDPNNDCPTLYSVLDM